MKQTFLTIFTIAVLVLAYGYWHSMTHGIAYIVLTLKADDNKIQVVINGSLENAEVFFMDKDGIVLAKGVNTDRNYLHLIHPEVGDCHEIVKPVSNSETRSLWQECLQKQSTWIPKWIRNVSEVQVKHKTCSTKNLPVEVKEHNSEWPLWWVPLPHVGGTPYSYFRADIVVSEEDCIK